MFFKKMLLAWTDERSTKRRQSSARIRALRRNSPLPVLESLEERLLLTISATEYSAGITPNSGPQDITPGQDGGLWFTETLANQIGRVSQDGTVTEFSVGISPNAGLHGITIGPGSGPVGDLWFTESNTDRIGRITATGTVTEYSIGITPGSAPQGITFGPDYDIWFTEFGGSRIGRITADGTVTEYSTGISPGSAPLEIAQGPPGTKSLWFTESTGNRIGKITTDGFVTEFSTGISPNSGLKGIALGQGGMWFTESTGNRIGKITSDGTVTEFSTGISPGSAPTGITRGVENVWFTEAAGDRIGSIAADGTISEFGTGITPNSGPTGIVDGFNGIVWFTEYSGNRLATLSTTVDLTASISADFDAPTNLLASGQPITLTATIPPGAAEPFPDGYVAFYNGTTYLGFAEIQMNGIATRTVTPEQLHIGTNSFTAVFESFSFLGGVSAPLVETVSPDVVQSEFANLVTATGNLATNIFNINYASGNLLTLDLNGSVFLFDPLVITTVKAIGKSNGDTAFVFGTAGSDVFTLNRGTIEMTGANAQGVAVAVDVTGITNGIVDGNGGSDATVMYTSDIDDTFIGAPASPNYEINYALLSGAGGEFSNYAYHSKVTAANRGGSGRHTATLFTSLNDDNLVATPTVVEIAGQEFEPDEAFDYIVQGYPVVAAYNGLNGWNASGIHTATLFTSSSSDIFVGDGENFGQMYDPSPTAAFNNIVYNFTYVVGVNDDQTPGVSHDAYLYTSRNADAFIAYPTVATLQETPRVGSPGAVFFNYSYTVQGFTTVSAFNRAESGADHADFAQLFGTASDDVFGATSTYAAMTNGSANDTVVYRNVVYGFSAVQATAAPGSANAVATLVDSVGGQTFTGNGSKGQFLNMEVTNFAEIDAYSTGGVDSTNLTALDYVFKRFATPPGSWAN